MLFKKLLFLCLFATATLGHAFDLSVADNGVLKSFPVCYADSNPGLPVAVIQSREAIWESGWTIASSTIDKNHRPVIYIDPIAFGDAPPEFQLWVYHHECYHQRENHIASFGFHPIVLEKREENADKWATLQIFNYGFTNSQIRTVYNTIKDVDFYVKHQSPPSHPTNVRLEKVNNRALPRDLDERAKAFMKSVRTIRTHATRF